MRTPLLVVIALAAVACSKKTPIPQEARDIFAQRCAPCHGTDGRGNGPNAASLNPKPRDYTSRDWQKSVTDDELRKVIVGGGPAVGKSPLMPPNPDLQVRPEVAAGLVAIVRGFGD
jgi:mono/diheme cytochrome c family protein